MTRDGMSEHAQHHRHGRSEVLAVALLAVEKKECQRIVRLYFRKFQRIAIVVAQIILDQIASADGDAFASNDASRQLANARVQPRQLQIHFAGAGWERVHR